MPDGQHLPPSPERGPAPAGPPTFEIIEHPMFGIAVEADDSELGARVLTIFTPPGTHRLYRLDAKLAREVSKKLISPGLEAVDGSEAPADAADASS